MSRQSEIIEDLSSHIAQQYELDPLNINMLIANWFIDNQLRIIKDDKNETPIQG